MIACVSPDESDLTETLSTFTYAARAKEIKNHVKVNKDIGSTLASQLQARIVELEAELERRRQVTLLIRSSEMIACLIVVFQVNREHAEASDEEDLNLSLPEKYRKTSEMIAEMFKERFDESLGNNPAIDDLISIEREVHLTFLTCQLSFSWPAFRITS